MSVAGSVLKLNKPILAVSDLVYTHLKQDEECIKYHGCRFKINGKSFVFRQAKITPTKNNQFVTIWKRTGRGPIQPYDTSDDIDLFVVNIY